MDDIFKRIREKKLRLDSYRPLLGSIYKNMEEWFRIELTYTSNAVEGNTLTRQETALVVEKGITVEGKSITEHLEAVNHAKAFDFIRKLVDKKIGDITERTILDIHSIILEKIDYTNAGRYRNVSVRIAGARVTLPNVMKVPDLMKEFINWLHREKYEAIKLAADAHFKFVSIHPFIDGNGRTARLLMNLILMQKGFPPAIIRKEDRNAYIRGIEKGQLQKDLSDYYEIIFKAVERSLDIYLEMLEPKEEQVIRSEKLLKIGEVAKMANEGIPTVRYWTKEGLLKVEEYSKGGYQLYSAKVIDRIKQIRKLQSEKRLTIEELKKVLI